MLVRLRDGVWVSPDRVQSVIDIEVKGDKRTMVVMKDKVNVYGCSGWHSDDWAPIINDALRVMGYS